MLRTANCKHDAETFSYDGPALSYELEHCLLFGKGSSGQLVLRHLELFEREWRRYREKILPKFIDAFPGRRPAAMYICGELPMRPVHMPLPLEHPGHGRGTLYVIADDSSGFWYRDWPEPYQAAEPAWLYEIDAIDRQELKAAAGRNRKQALRDYQWDHGVTQ